MIIKASQRGGGKALGLHLLKTEENEHVEVHEVRGFVSDDVVGAMKEAYAVSLGTRCRQFLFSVSLNPPETEHVGVDVFETVAERIEQKTGLKDHPRIIVFHEKEVIVSPLNRCKETSVLPAPIDEGAFATPSTP